MDPLGNLQINHQPSPTHTYFFHTLFFDQAKRMKLKGGAGGAVVDPLEDLQIRVAVSQSEV